MPFLTFSNSNGYFPSSNSTSFFLLSNCYREKNRKDSQEMCTPWTLTRFIRWRVRDLASCFLACRFPLEQESETHRSSSPQLPIRNMVFETKDDGRDQSSNKRQSRRNRCNKQRQLNLSPRDTDAVENESENSSRRQRFSDEEFIVFCFREDGAFDVVKDCSKSEELSNQSSRSSWPVNPKLTYAEDAEIDKQSSDVGRSNEDRNEGEIIPAKEGDEERSSTCLEVELGSDSSRRSRHQIAETPKQGTFSVESSDSNQSDGSTGSFAFPVLRWELMGSPVQMPKSEGLTLNPRKNKAHSLGFQCLRF